jgi:hypothetical protein
MRAFVIRGFGQKAGVDLDRVHVELIGPALQQVGAAGGTTGEIVEAGNVREDMFRELVLPTSSWPTSPCITRTSSTSSVSVMPSGTGRQC